jgi:hypothetical protein
MSPYTHLHILCLKSGRIAIVTSLVFVGAVVCSTDENM